MINKIVRKSMLKKKGLIVAIAVLIIISSGFISISHFVYDGMQNNYDQTLIEANVEDFRLMTLPLPEEREKEVYPDEMIKGLETDYDLKLEKGKTAYYRTEDNEERTKPNYGISIYNSKDKIDQLILEEGQIPSAADEIAIQPEALRLLELSLGDEIKVGDISYKITGTMTIPTQMMPSDFMNNVMAPDFEKFLPLVMSDEGVKKLEATGNLTYREFYKGTFDQELSTFKERNAVYAKVQEDSRFEMPITDANGMPQIDEKGEVRMEAVDTLFAWDRDLNLSISGVQSEINTNRTVFTFLAALMTVITIFLTVILVNSVFKSQRREMGIMKAEGVSIGKLSFGFSLFIALLILIFSSVGVLAGYFGSNIFHGLYEEVFMLKDYQVGKNVLALIAQQVTLIGLVMLAVIYLLSIRRNLHTPTLHLVKNINSEKMPKYNVGKLLKWLPFVRRYQLNLMLRNISKTLLIAYAVFVSSFLILLGILMYGSINDMMNGVYSNVFTYETVVNFSKNDVMTYDDLENGFVQQSVDLEAIPKAAEDKLDEPLAGTETVDIQAFNFAENTVVHLKDRDKKAITNEQGLIATSGFLKKYNLKVGDKFSVLNPYDVDEKIELEITAETSDYFMPSVFMPLDKYYDTFDAPEGMITGFMSEKELTVEERKELSEKDESVNVFNVPDMEKMLEDNMYMINISITFIGILAALIAFVALYSISSVIIESNSKTISVMKVLGYSAKEVRTMTVGIYKWLVIGIYIVSIPLLKIIIQSVVDFAMAAADFSLTIDFNYFYMSFGLIIIISIYALSSKMTYSKIQRIKLAESLKADE